MAPDIFASNSSNESATSIQADTYLHKLAGASTATNLFSLANFGSATTGYAAIVHNQTPAVSTTTTSALSTPTDAGRNSTGSAPFAIVTVSSSHLTVPNVVHSTSIGQSATTHALAGLHPIAGATTATGFFSFANFRSVKTGYVPVGPYQTPGVLTMAGLAPSAITTVSSSYLTAPNVVY